MSDESWKFFRYTAYNYNLTPFYLNQFIVRLIDTYMHHLVSLSYQMLIYISWIIYVVPDILMPWCHNISTYFYPTKQSISLKACNRFHGSLNSLIYQPPTWENFDIQQ